MRKMFAVSVAALALFAGAAHAGPSAEVNAEEFYVAARALEEKGALALFDSRMKPMRKQMKDAGLSARTANAAATKRGDPLYCVSEAERKKGAGVEKVLGMLEALGRPLRTRLTLEDAWMAALKRTYPCS